MWVNRRGVEWFGVPREATYGWSWLDLVHPDDVEVTQAAWEHAVRERTPYEADLRMRDASGEFSVVLREGRKRQIRRIANTLGYHVRRLVRTQIDTLSLGVLKPGEPTNFFEKHEYELMQRYQSQEITDKERVRLLQEFNKRFAQDYQLLDEHRGQGYNENVPGGLRTYSLVRSIVTKRPENRWLMLAGTVLFSGSLYLLAVTGQRWLGAITPLGGVAFIAAWLLLAWAARGLAR